MIPIDYRDRCDIYRRQATDKYGGLGADQYDQYAVAEPCRFVESEGRLERQNESGRNIIYSGILLTDAEIRESDVVIIADIEYSVLNVQTIRHPITGVIVYYRAHLQRVTAADAATKQDEPVVNV